MADLPEPVGITASTSRPARTAAAAASWPGRRSSKPNADSATSRTSPSSSSLWADTHPALPRPATMWSSATDHRVLRRSCQAGTYDETGKPPTNIVTPSDRYHQGMDDRPMRVFGPGELNGILVGASPPTSDDVSITTDGRRLDTAEKVIEFFAELAMEQAGRRSGASSSAAD